MTNDMRAIRPACQHCGGVHDTTCPRIAAIDYDASGQIKRIEFHAPSPVGLQVRASLSPSTFGLSGPEAKREAECDCHACWVVRTQQQGPMAFRPFIVCSECGNKRCPKATNHEYECTGSNEPGQAGSIYGEV